MFLIGYARVSTDDQCVEAARKVCDARMRHVAAYERFQSAYARLTTVLEKDRRINLLAATDQLKQFVRSCIYHKIYITTGGHNIMMDIIPNEAAADCLELGANMVMTEANELSGPSKIVVSPAHTSDAVDYRWSFVTGTGGISEAAIKSQDGSIFSISCAAAGTRSMEVSLSSPLLLTSRATDMQVVVGGDSFQFELTGGTAKIGGRIKVNQLMSLVDALTKTGERHFTVELPTSQARISFSTLEARKWLTGILDGCLNPKSSIKSNEVLATKQPLNSTKSASYVGKWYDGDPSVCRNKLGQPNAKGNWATDYTDTKVFGQEYACKVLSARHKKHSTELSLRCAAEGMDFNMKQVVRVINGRLHVSYRENGRSRTAIYHRCH